MYIHMHFKMFRATPPPKWVFGGLLKELKGIGSWYAFDMFLARFWRVPDHELIGFESY